MSISFKGNLWETIIFYDEKLAISPLYAYKVIRELIAEESYQDIEYHRDLEKNIIYIWRDLKVWLIFVDTSRLVPNNWNLKITIQCVPGDHEAEKLAGEIYFDLMDGINDPTEALFWLEDYFDPKTERKRTYHSSEDTLEEQPADQTFEEHVDVEQDEILVKNSEVYIPQQLAVRERWKAIWEIIKPMWEAGDTSYKTILDHLDIHHHDLFGDCSTRATLLKIIRWGKAGMPKR